MSKRIERPKPLIYFAGAYLPKSHIDMLKTHDPWICNDPRVEAMQGYPNMSAGDRDLLRLYESMFNGQSNTTATINKKQGN